MGSYRKGCCIGRRQFVLLGAAAASSTMLFGITGCAPGESGGSPSSNDGPQSNEAGVYTAEAQGKKGPVTVQVSFTDSAIESVEVVDHHETPRISATPFETIPQTIVGNQSLGVDAVTGATLSSMAVINGVKDCVKQAGGNASALEKVAVEKAEPEEVEIDADIVVIGSGSSGMAAALEGAIKGGKVVVFEKCPYIGGNALVSGGVLTYIGAPQELRQEMTDGYREYFSQALVRASEMGVPQEKIDEVQKQFDEYYEQGNTTVFDSVEWSAIYNLLGVGIESYDETLYQTMLKLSGENIELMNWLEPFEVGYKKLVAVAGYPWPNNTSPTTGECGEGYFKAFDSYMADKALPIDILFSTPASELVTEGGSVVGVKGSCTDGTVYTVKAAKGVVIASGGFSGNPDLVRKYDDEWNFADIDSIPTTNGFGHTGDGLEMALAVGGQFASGVPNYMVLPFANAIDQSVESIVGDSGNALLVNKEGKRFVNESLSRNEISRAQMEQPDQMSHLISDVNNSLIEGDVNMFGANVQLLLDGGKLFVADTLEELAATIGVDADALVETVENYNEYARAGVDPDFGRTLFTEASPVVQGPFYANPCSWAMHITSCGIATEQGTYAVLDESGSPIPGLYAIGECASEGGITNMHSGIAVADQLLA